MLAFDIGVCVGVCPAPLTAQGALRVPAPAPTAATTAAAAAAATAATAAAAAAAPPRAAGAAKAAAVPRMSQPAPTGKRLRLEILSTWGDESYVGLNGIQVRPPDSLSRPRPPAQSSLVSKCYLCFHSAL